jgi:hypothetical protein
MIGKWMLDADRLTRERAERQIEQATTLLVAVSGAIRRKSGDLDAIVPPSSLSRVQDQLVRALRTVAVYSDSLGLAFQLQSCRREERADIACDFFGRQSESVQAMTAALASQHAAVHDFLDARERARSILANHGVVLPPMDPAVLAALK